MIPMLPSFGPKLSVKIQVRTRKHGQFVDTDPQDGPSRLKPEIGSDEETETLSQ